MQKRQDMINNFNHTNKNMLHDEIIFHMKRGETLIIQSAQGKWLRSIYWGYLPNGEYAPVVCNWDNRIESTCSLDDIPCIGPQTINDERLIVSFCKFHDKKPIWVPDGPKFITPLPTFNLRENLKSEMTKQGLDAEALSKKSEPKEPDPDKLKLRIQCFLNDKHSELPNAIIKKLVCVLKISEAKLRGYGDDEYYISAFETQDDCKTTNRIE